MWRGSKKRGDPGWHSGNGAKPRSRGNVVKNSSQPGERVALWIGRQIRPRVTAMGKPLHAGLRRRKMQFFDEIVGGTARTCSLLDLGGTPGLVGEFARVHRMFASVTVANLQPSHLAGVFSVHRVAADGCLLPFPAGAFDWVFSNAVLEHVGDWDRQQAFAAEIRRVARKGYFVATPNRRFPIEPHTYLPLYQFFPSKWKQRTLRFAPGYVKDCEGIRLLSSRELKVLFPKSRVIRSPRLLGTSLIAYWRASMP